MARVLHQPGGAGAKQSEQDFNKKVAVEESKTTPLSHFAESVLVLAEKAKGRVSDKDKADITDACDHLRKAMAQRMDVTDLD